MAKEVEELKTSLLIQVMKQNVNHISATKHEEHVMEADDNENDEIITSLENEDIDYEKDESAKEIKYLDNDVVDKEKENVKECEGNSEDDAKFIDEKDPHSVAEYLKGHPICKDGESHQSNKKLLIRVNFLKITEFL